MKKLTYLVVSLLASLSLASCSDFFDVESTHFIDADKNHLSTATDTIYSMVGILNKVQAIGDRTVLLGEMRGDLMSVTANTSADLREVARFEIGDDNVYNQPRDYYAIINNCNYFIAHADTAMKNNRNEYIFLREYAAAKAIRAWTYLQLVTTYGRVPFVLEPVLSESEAAKDYPMYDIQQVCNYFAHEDGLLELARVGYPEYGDIRRMSSKLLFFPIYIVLGDLNLWAGNYWEAATNYHDYIINRQQSGYPISMTAVTWSTSANDWNPARETNYSTYRRSLTTFAYSAQSEFITVIPSDSLPSEGNYSQLKDVFNSRSENEYRVSAMPSKALFDLSAKQDFWTINPVTEIFSAAPKNLKDHADGDLRLYASYSTLDGVMYRGERVPYYQRIYKFPAGDETVNIPVYRRAQVYLRLAEAANRAGYPAYAFQILSTGLDNDVLKEKICPMYASDSAKLVNYLGFPTPAYTAYDPLALAQQQMNTIGVHMRGCGYTMGDSLYVLPMPETELSSAADTVIWQQEKVEDLIVDEMALELAFEGSRFYDLMRVALHRDDPQYLAKKIMARDGEDGDPGVEVDLGNKANWFLHWRGQIGY